MARTWCSRKAPVTCIQSSALLRVEKPSLCPWQDPTREEDGATSHQLSWTSSWTPSPDPLLREFSPSFLWMALSAAVSPSLSLWICTPHTPMERVSCPNFLMSKSNGEIRSQGPTCSFQVYFAKHEKGTSWDAIEDSWVVYVMGQD